MATCKEAESIMPNITINSGVGECRNVSFAEDYIVVWEGKRIKELKIKVLYGRMCPEEMITQKFTVTFVSANATSMEEFSGNPGYQLGKPVRATNLTSSAPVTTLKLWKPGLNASSSTNTSEGSLRGICPDVPAHLNIQIITADVGAIEGIPQEEILGVQLRFQINYTEYDCRRNDVCWPELFYPMTRYYTGEPYSHTLAKGLVLVFFVLLAVVLSGPWNGILCLWNKP
ncbi:hypothetical protein E2320_012495 [Naja naja]|nr:hypothetical protein E2320_012495 [Naja naja]